MLYVKMFYLFYLFYIYLYILLYTINVYIYILIFLFVNFTRSSIILQLQISRRKLLHNPQRYGVPLRRKIRKLDDFESIFAEFCTSSIYSRATGFCCKRIRESVHLPAEESATDRIHSVVHSIDYSRVPFTALTCRFDFESALPSILFVHRSACPLIHTHIYI